MADFFPYLTDPSSEILMMTKRENDGLLFISAPEMTEVASVEGSSAHLPCDISPPDPGERLALVLWYRRDEGEPIYRSVSAWGTGIK